jgi:hypothetical protein
VFFKDLTFIGGSKGIKTPLFLIEFETLFQLRMKVCLNLTYIKNTLIICSKNAAEEVKNLIFEGCKNPL